MAETRFLVPCRPSKVLAVGLNYASHREYVESSEGVIVNAAGRPVPSDYPGVFAKFPTSLIPDGEEIVFPDGASNVHFEGELVLIVGRRAKNVAVEGFGRLRPDRPGDRQGRRLRQPRARDPRQRRGAPVVEHERAGDTIEVEIEGVGVLRNTVAR